MNKNYIKMHKICDKMNKNYIKMHKKQVQEQRTRATSKHKKKKP